MFLFLFVLFILWDYYRTKNEYFADYVDRWGIPEGVVELSAEQVKKRSTHYRFEYTHRSILGKGKGTLKRVVFANSAGFPIEHNFSEYVDRSSIQQIESRKDRRGQSVIEIEYQNSKQKPLIVAYIAGDSLQYVDLKSLDKGMGIGLTSSFTSITSNAFESMFSNSKSEIRRYRLIRDRQGFIISYLKNITVTTISLLVMQREFMALIISWILSEGPGWSDLSGLKVLTFPIIWG